MDPKGLVLGFWGHHATYFLGGFERKRRLTCIIWTMTKFLPVQFGSRPPRPPTPLTAPQRPRPLHSLPSGRGRTVTCPKSPQCQKLRRKIFLWLQWSCSGKVGFGCSRMEGGGSFGDC